MTNATAGAPGKDRAPNSRRFEWFVAWRYIFSRERKLLFSAITLISLAGVALGVAAMIIVQGVMDGADTMIFGKIADLSPHVRIRHADNAPFTPEAKLLGALRADGRVRQAEPVISRLTIVQIPETQATCVVQLIGQDVLGKTRLYNIPNLNNGEDIKLWDRELLLGAPVFLGELHLPRPPQRAPAGRLVSTQLTDTAMGPQPKMLNVELPGCYTTGFPELDSVCAFVNEATIRELYLLPEGYDYIHVLLRDAWQAEAFADWLRNDLKLGPEFQVTTWAQENSKFFSALKLEKFGMFVTMLLVVIVAAFNIIGTMILMVIQKTREIGILRAMGASPAMVQRIFLFDGMIIGIVGTALGTALGLLGSYFIPKIKFQLAGAIDFDHIPVETRATTVLIIIAVSIVICTLAALYPARQAARLNPIEALKFE